MIIGDLEHWKNERAGFSPVLQKAIDYIQDTDLKSLEPGNYEIDGENMFAVVQQLDTCMKSDRMAECHERYIDVQYLISGHEEMIYVARQSEQHVIVEDLLEEKDCVFYDVVSGEFEVILKPGMFAVFFPSDIHRPGCNRLQQVSIKKVVIKIKKNLLGG